MSLELFIFRAGKYPQGDWPEERVQRMVDAYDPEKNHEAPVVIGHRYYSPDDEGQFAHGWVQSLRMDKGKVFAVVESFSAEVAKAIAEKKLRYISVEILEYDQAVEGSKLPPYLRAIALLGRDSPAVPDTRIPAFFSQGIFSSRDEQNYITTFVRRLEKQEFCSGSPLPKGGENQFNEESIYMEETEKLAKLTAELAAANERLAAFQKENETLRAGERKTEAQTFFSKLRDEGKLPPALFERAVSLDAKMNEEERKEYRALFTELKAQVDLTGTHAAPKGKAPNGIAEQSITAKIRAFQKEKGIASFADAAEAFYEANPAAFEEGAAE